MIFPSVTEEQQKTIDENQALVGVYLAIGAALVGALCIRTHHEKRPRELFKCLEIRGIWKRACTAAS